jgi:hypothetical protein
MASTFLAEVNKVLQGSNEVVLTATNFATAVGVQDYAKTVINTAYLEICSEEEEWPWLSAAASNINAPYSWNITMETVAGQRWYLIKTGSTSLVTDYSKIDWDSFTLTTEGATGRTAPYVHEDLTYTTFNHWKKKYSSQEEADAGSEQTYGIPTRVVESKDGRYLALSPIPDSVYGIYFEAWVNPTNLSAYGDAILIPDMYLPVLQHRAREYFLDFKKDIEESTKAGRNFERGMRTMRRNLIGNQSDYMRDDRYQR